METNLHMVFPGTCNQAFAFYEQTFGTTRIGTMTFADAPPGAPVPPDAGELIMHTAMRLGTITLMGCDSPPGRQAFIGGFQIALTLSDEAEVRRLFETLSEGGAVTMELTPTFWSPLFGMLVDRFGVGWMVTLPGPTPS